ncbi:acyl-CoA dehydrogenase family protein [Nocardia sp. NBC_01329]|uniref:acyl-CoA dehydrogenase family protein n=1 Tax=Nocardia sp. NBC_01329 TaxID=2903594 RepID=UPI002E10865F|nr:acyl-CoA/acyl-ACP dehydrogenase [Nocardia sp. NBC_01329]
MNDIIAELEAAVGEACAKHGGTDSVSASSTGGWNPRLWAALEQIGVTAISVAEEHGGSGGDISTAVAVLEVLGQHSVGVPLAETALLAGWLLADCGAVLPSGPMTACLAGSDLRLERKDDNLSVHGTVARVPWARCVDHVVVLGAGRVVLLHRDDFRVREGTNLAGEPRDDISIATSVPLVRVHDVTVESGISDRGFRTRAALARAAHIAGAARRALELAVTYAGEREQFGRPIAGFQAVQQHLAAMAGEVLLAKVAVEAAALALDTEDDPDVAVAAAKAVAGQVAGLVSSLAHQVHGAIGFTDEHPLHYSTTRLWAWRDEAGNENYWSTELGRRAVSAGSHGLWPLLVGKRSHSARR